jgi:hypothetical protein
VHGGCVHHQTRPGNVGSIMPYIHVRPGGTKLIQGGGFTDIRATDTEPSVHQYVGKAVHARTANADKMNVTVFMIIDMLHCFIIPINYLVNSRLDYNQNPAFGQEKRKISLSFIQKLNYNKDIRTERSVFEGDIWLKLSEMNALLR